jgi:hypothetical protein
VQANRVFEAARSISLGYLVAVNERENCTVGQGWCDACCGTSNVHLILMMFGSSEIAKDLRLYDRVAMFRVIHNV